MHRYDPARQRLGLAALAGLVAALRIGRGA
jgi:hypothetical protein